MTEAGPTTNTCRNCRYRWLRAARLVSRNYRRTCNPDAKTTYRDQKYRTFRTWTVFMDLAVNHSPPRLDVLLHAGVRTGTVDTCCTTHSTTATFLPSCCVFGRHTHVWLTFRHAATGSTLRFDSTWAPCYATFTPPGLHYGWTVRPPGHLTLPVRTAAVTLPVFPVGNSG